MGKIAKWRVSSFLAGKTAEVKKTVLYSHDTNRQQWLCNIQLGLIRTRLGSMKFLALLESRKKNSSFKFT